MTSRERLLLALRHQVPDYVPVSPDVSNMMPARYTGKPFWEVYVNENPPMWQAHLDLQRRFGYDMVMGVALGNSPNDPPSERTVLAKNDDAWIVEEVIHTRRGDLSIRTQYPRDRSPWVVKPIITDPEAEEAALLATLTDPWTKDASEARAVKAAVADRGIICSGLPVPLAWWLYQRRHLDQAVLDFYDRPQLVERILAVYSEWALEALKAMASLIKPDMFMFGGSVASMSVVSPALYRRYAFPFLCEAVQIARSNGVLTGVHMCGRCGDALDMLAEAGVDMVEPLESPPGGDVSLAEVKRRYGARLCLKGNVNTFQTLARGTPEDVVAEARQCMVDAGDGGGFILSTGDQVPGDTPEANFVALISAARRYGVYARDGSLPILASV